VLVGPSAAYCIDDAFFTRWRRMTILEPDPIARLLLGRRLARLGAPSPRYVIRDALFEPLLDGRPGLDAILREEPRASVLFANLLGQLPFLVPESRTGAWHDAWAARVLPELVARPWASFHDRLSTNVRPTATGPVTFVERPSDEALAAKLFDGARGRLELHEHLDGPLFSPSIPHTYFHWELEPGVHQVIEATRDVTRRTS
jgi:hypothetical protein